MKSAVDEYKNALAQLEPLRLKAIQELEQKIKHHESNVKELISEFLKRISMVATDDLKTNSL